MKESMKTIIPDRLTINGNNNDFKNKNFSLSNINFDVIYNNLEKSRLEAKKESNNDNNDIKKITFDLRCKMRKDLYQLIDASEINLQSNNIINNDNGNILGKKRNSDIPLIDLTRISIKKE